MSSVSVAVQQLQPRTTGTSLQKLPRDAGTSLHHHSAFQNNAAELRKGLSDTVKEEGPDQKVLGFLELLLMLRKTGIEVLHIHHQSLQHICSIHLVVVPMTLKAFWTSD